MPKRFEERDIDIKIEAMCCETDAHTIAGSFEKPYFAALYGSGDNLQGYQTLR